MVNAYFVKENGEPADADGTIFPICNILKNKLNFIGTGFFITDNGMFVTAKHVLEDEPGPLYIAHFFEEGKYILRGIPRSSQSTISDFAIGITTGLKSKHTGLDLKNKCLKLSSHIPAEGEPISTYAYPESKIENTGETSRAYFKSEWYHGTVIEIYPDGAGHIKSPALVADMQSLGGCSGGPVFSKNGLGGVVGINSRGIVDQVNIVSLTSALLDVNFFDVNILDKHFENISIQQLIDFGYISIT